MQGIPDSADHEADLAVFYDRHSAVPTTRASTRHRVECREWFIRLLKAEHRHSVFELGCGTGIEGREFIRAGLHYCGVDCPGKASGWPAPKALRPAWPVDGTCRFRITPSPLPGQ
ncbi:class I SAM-dependent methyltransferase [Pseudarthrobacter enclensis]|uniref:hypothetical protein n=1 Tax=Pseudarthrobacter enclensis TaxID=993070 RepID=UPI000AF429C7|nr:hypothetical protein [Pseudarthrobacter enclensis]